MAVIEMSKERLAGAIKVGSRRDGSIIRRPCTGHSGRSAFGHR